VPELGAFGVTATPGIVAWGIREVTNSTVNHAVGYVGPQTFDYNGKHYVNEPAIAEANPSGAALAPLWKYAHVIWSPAPPDGKGQAVADAYLSLLGTPYSWVDDACIGLTHLFGIHVPEPVRKRLNRRDRLECAQYVDVAWTKCGLHLFKGLIPGDVAPSDLLIWIKAHAHIQA
jgi:hypothetical protein